MCGDVPVLVPSSTKHLIRNKRTGMYLQAREVAQLCVVWYNDTVQYTHTGIGSASGNAIHSRELNRSGGSLENKVDYRQDGRFWTL